MGKSCERAKGTSRAEIQLRRGSAGEDRAAACPLSVCLSVFLSPLLLHCCDVAVAAVKAPAAGFSLSGSPDSAQ